MMTHLKASLDKRMSDMSDFQSKMTLFTNGFLSQMSFVSLLVALSRFLS